MGLDKPRAGQFDDLRLGDLRIEGPVEVSKSLHDGDAGLFEAARECNDDGALRERPG